MVVSTDVSTVLPNVCAVDDGIGRVRSVRMSIPIMIMACMTAGQINLKRAPRDVDVLATAVSSLIYVLRPGVFMFGAVRLLIPRWHDDCIY